jgi:hypothetical protein
MEEKEEQRDLDALQGKAIDVAGAVALQESVGLEFSQIVSQLVKAVSRFGEAEGSEDGLMDLPGGPAAEVRASMAAQSAASHSWSGNTVPFPAFLASDQPLWGAATRSTNRITQRAPARTFAATSACLPPHVGWPKPPLLASFEMS